MQRTFVVGEQVVHDQEGAGVVVCVDTDGTIIVQFTNGDYRMAFVIDQQWHIAKAE